MSAQACSWVTNPAIQRCPRETRPSRCNLSRRVENRDHSRYNPHNAADKSPPTALGPPVPARLLTPAAGVGLRGRSAGREGAPEGAALSPGSCRLDPPKAPRRRAGLAGRAAVVVPPLFPRRPATAARPAPPRFPLPSRRRLPPALRAAPPAGPSPPPAPPRELVPGRV